MNRNRKIYSNKQKVILTTILLIITTLSVSVGGHYIYVTWGEIGPPKTTTPSRTFSKSEHPKDIAYQMIRDMYPGEKIIMYSGENYEADHNTKVEECVNVWCIYDDEDGDGVTVSNFRKKEGSVSEEYDVEESVKFEIGTFSNGENYEAKKRRDEKAKKLEKYDNYVGLSYYKTEATGPYMMYCLLFALTELTNKPENSRGIVGYKHNLPFFEYFTKIEFRD